MDPTQANPTGPASPPGGDPAPPTGAAPSPPAPADLAPPPSAFDAPPAAGPEPRSPQLGLIAWLGIIVLGSLLSAALGHAEGGLFFALAGVFVLAQGSDAAVAFQGYRHWVRDRIPERSAAGTMFRLIVRSLVPIAAALFYIGLGGYALGDTERAARPATAAWSFVAAAACLLLVSRRLADRLTRLLFRVEVPTRTQRLTARLVVVGLFLPLPMAGLLPELMKSMGEQDAPLASPGALLTQLVGELAVALAGVGWLLRRSWREVLERLGLGPVRPSYAGVVVLGLVGAVGLNAGMEALQHAWLPVLWTRDQEATRLIAGDMPVWTALLLGLSAGFGEEVTLRGALQPRLGIVLTAVFFACGHVQYSWWGMLTIALLGALLGLVRNRTNTTTAILVHALYDVFAVLTSKG